MVNASPARSPGDSAGNGTLGFSFSQGSSTRGSPRRVPSPLHVRDSLVHSDPVVWRRESLDGSQAALVRPQLSARTPGPAVSETVPISDNYAFSHFTRSRNRSTEGSLHPLARPEPWLPIAEMEDRRESQRDRLDQIAEREREAQRVMIEAQRETIQAGDEVIAALREQIRQMQERIDSTEDFSQRIRTLERIFPQPDPSRYDENDDVLLERTSQHFQNLRGYFAARAAGLPAEVPHLEFPDDSAPAATSSSRSIPPDAVASTSTLQRGYASTSARSPRYSVQRENIRQRLNDAYGSEGEEMYEEDDEVDGEGWNAELQPPSLGRGRISATEHRRRLIAAIDSYSPRSSTTTAPQHMQGDQSDEEEPVVPLDDALDDLMGDANVIVEDDVYHLTSHARQLLDKHLEADACEETYRDRIRTSSSTRHLLNDRKAQFNLEMGYVDRNGDPLLLPIGNNRAEGCKQGSSRDDERGMLSRRIGLDLPFR